jgi:hypothetical protein
VITKACTPKAIPTNTLIVLQRSASSAGMIIRSLRLEERITGSVHRTFGTGGSSKSYSLTYPAY